MKPQRLFILPLIFSLTASADIHAENLGGKLFGGIFICAGVLGTLAVKSQALPAPYNSPSYSNRIETVSAITAGAGALIFIASSLTLSRPSSNRNSSGRGNRKVKIHKDLLPYYRSGQTPPYQPLADTTSTSDLLLSPWYWWFPGNIWHSAFQSSAQPIFEEQNKAHDLPTLTTSDVEAAHTGYLRTHSPVDMSPTDVGSSYDRDHDGIPDTVDRDGGAGWSNAGDHSSSSSSSSSDYSGSSGSDSSSSYDSGGGDSGGGGGGFD